jgi:hypothetical protein
MSNSIIPGSYGPFPDRDLFRSYSTKHLGLFDIARAAQVCKAWNQSFSDQSLWKLLFEREGIPLVCSINGGERNNYRDDFKVLYPITISGKIISQFFGKVIEEVPPISEECFNELNQPDPFEKGKSKVENYVLIVMPTKIARTVDKETPLALDDLGNLIVSPKQENELNLASKQELEIPFSLRNIKVLCSYPLKGKENMPVFNEGGSTAEVFEQCGACPNKINVYFMRRHIVDQSRGEHYADQEELVKAEGFEVTPLRERVLFNFLQILQDGTCPDARNPWTCARSPDTVHYGNDVYQSVVGGFTPRDGVHVRYSHCFGIKHTGVVPGGSAEVLQPLPLDEGHLAKKRRTEY